MLSLPRQQALVTETVSVQCCGQSAAEAGGEGRSLPAHRAAEPGGAASARVDARWQPLPRYLSEQPQSHRPGSPRGQLLPVLSCVAAVLATVGVKNSQVVRPCPE